MAAAVMEQDLGTALLLYQLSDLVFSCSAKDDSGWGKE